jgi:hypothetical protein
MTKSITIQYSEADETVLMSIFKKFKVKIFTAAPAAPADDDDMEEGVPLEVAHQMVEALKWIQKVERGEAEPMGSFEDLIAELKAEEKEVELV